MPEEEQSRRAEHAYHHLQNFLKREVERLNQLNLEDITTEADVALHLGSIASLIKQAIELKGTSDLEYSDREPSQLRLETENGTYTIVATYNPEHTKLGLRDVELTLTRKPEMINQIEAMKCRLLSADQDYQVGVGNVVPQITVDLRGPSGGVVQHVVNLGELSNLTPELTALLLREYVRYLIRAITSFSSSLPRLKSASYNDTALRDVGKLVETAEQHPSAHAILEGLLVRNPSEFSFPQSIIDASVEMSEVIFQLIVEKGDNFQRVPEFWQGQTDDAYLFIQSRDETYIVNHSPTKHEPSSAAAEDDKFTLYIVLSDFEKHANYTVTLPPRCTLRYRRDGKSVQMQISDTSTPEQCQLYAEYLQKLALSLQKLLPENS